MASQILLVLLITGEGNQACYPIKYDIKLINIIHNIVQWLPKSDLKQFNDGALIISDCKSFHMLAILQV